MLLLWLILIDTLPEKCQLERRGWDWGTGVEIGGTVVEVGGTGDEVGGTRVEVELIFWANCRFVNEESAT